MTTFILSQEPMPQIAGKKSEAGRVILDWQAHGDIIGTIEADDVTETYEVNGSLFTRIVVSAWRAAREKVDESKFFHIENKGWFYREAS